MIYDWSGPGGFTSTDSNPIVTEIGTYTLTVTPDNGCFSTTTAEVISDFSAPSASLDADALDCNQTETQINTDPTTDATSFSWTGPNGFTSSDEDPFVSVAGTYTLVVGGANGCTTTVTIDVAASTDVPDAVAQGGTINCLTNEVTLSGSSTTPGVSYQWSGPDGFTSTDPNPVVSESGIYVLTVISPNGCQTTSTAEVTNDSSAPSTSVNAGSLSCNQPSTQIMSNPSADAIGFSWTGPNGFTSNDENPTVTMPGIYTLVVSGSNGCSSSATVDVTGDFNAPNASATGGTLGCNSTGISLSGNSTSGGVTFQWSGPGGFTSNEQNPVAMDVGEYTLTVMSSNGCTTSVIAVVDASMDVPQISATGGSIDCNNSSVQLMGSSASANVTISWTGPNNFSSTEANPVVTVPGIYTFSVAAANGCVATLNAQVIDDTAQPEVMLSLSGTDCDAGTRRILTQSNVTNMTVSWTGPNGFTSSELSPTISLAGTYTLETFPASGCNSTHTITMDEDVSYTAEVTTEDITSANPEGSATIIIDGGTGPFTILWDNGETNFTAVDLAEGEHTVVVTDGLGCVRTFEFFIDNLTSVFETELKNEINFYPNPASDFFTIDYSETSKTIVSIDVFNLEGKVMKHVALDTNENTLTVSVDGWSTGVYFVKVNTSSSYFTTSVLVE